MGGTSDGITGRSASSPLWRSAWADSLAATAASATASCAASAVLAVGVSGGSVRISKAREAQPQSAEAIKPATRAALMARSSAPRAC